MSFRLQEGCVYVLLSLQKSCEATAWRVTHAKAPVALLQNSLSWIKRQNRRVGSPVVGSEVPQVCPGDLVGVPWLPEESCWSSPQSGCVLSILRLTSVGHRRQGKLGGVPSTCLKPAYLVLEKRLSLGFSDPSSGLRGRPPTQSWPEACGLGLQGGRY